MAWTNLIRNATIGLITQFMHSEVVREFCVGLLNNLRQMREVQATGDTYLNLNITIYNMYL